MKDAVVECQLSSLIPTVSCAWQRICAVITSLCRSIQLLVYF